MISNKRHSICLQCFIYQVYLIYEDTSSENIITSFDVQGVTSKQWMTRRHFIFLNSETRASEVKEFHIMNVLFQFRLKFSFVNFLSTSNYYVNIHTMVLFNVPWYIEKFHGIFFLWDTLRSFRRISKTWSLCIVLENNRIQ